MPAHVHTKRPPPRTLVKRRTLGFLTDSFTDYYQLALLGGAMAAARDRKAGLVAFAGRVPAAETAVGSLVSTASIDGLVVTAPTMSYRMGNEAFVRYACALGPSPVCFIAGQGAGVHSALADNRGGMRAAVVHLVTAHGKKKIAFLRGYVGNPEAEERFSAYRAALEEHGIAYDEALVVVGNFERYTARDALLAVLERGIVPDAVAASNDLMALGAIDALGTRGLSVPGDVAVVGFDDSDEGRFASPTLTSVRQPLEALGRSAAKLVFEILEGGTPPPTSTVPLELMVRGSCGCEGQSSGLGRARSGLAGRSLHTWLIDRRALIAAEMTRAGHAALGRVSASWAERLLTAFVDDVRGVRPRAFMTVLDEELASSRASGGQLALFQRIITVLRDEARQAGDAETLEAAEDKLHEAREHIAREMQHEQAALRLGLAARVRSLRNAGIDLAAVTDYDALATTLVDHVSRLGFRRAYVALADPEPGMSRLVVGWDRELPFDSVKEAQRFRTLDLIPTDLRAADDTTPWVVLPLSRGAERLGHLVLDASGGDGIVWESLCEQIAIAVVLCARR
jgi:DNA-binding LacI/PurR family transcriptional regulator